MSTRSILAAVRRRYLATPRLQRPPLDHPAGVAGLLTAPEAVSLARQGTYPLSSDAVRRAPRRTRLGRMIVRELERILPDALAVELPEAVEMLVRDALRRGVAG